MPSIAQSDKSTPRLSHSSDVDPYMNNYSYLSENGKHYSTVIHEGGKLFDNSNYKISPNRVSEEEQSDGAKITESRYFKIPEKNTKQTTHTFDSKQAKISNIQNLQSTDDKTKVIEEAKQQNKEEFSRDESTNNCESPSEEPSFPVLFLDVNLGGGVVKRLIIKDGDDPMKISTEFCKEYNLSEKKEHKLKLVIQKQLANVLTKIKEEDSDY